MRNTPPPQSDALLKIRRVGDTIDEEKLDPNYHQKSSSRGRSQTRVYDSHVGDSHRGRFSKDDLYARSHRVDER